VAGLFFCTTARSPPPSRTREHADGLLPATGRIRRELLRRPVDLPASSSSLTGDGDGVGDEPLFSLPFVTLPTPGVDKLSMCGPAPRQAFMLSRIPLYPEETGDDAILLSSFQAPATARVLGKVYGMRIAGVFPNAGVGSLRSAIAF
jgi:hypothetical protein